MAEREEEAGPGGLDLLIAPTPPETFFARHHDQAPLHCARDHPRRYAHLLTLEGVDAFIDGADLRDGMAELIRGGTRVPVEAFTSAEGRIIASAVAEHYLQGATIALPHLQQSLPALGHLCRELEALFSCHVQANAYLTSGGCSGFDPHHDEHDVFVLQVEGAKTWRLYERRPPNAFRGDAAVGAPDASSPSETVTLHPGDCLYLPRGWVHAASNEAIAPSLHISIGLLTLTWADLLLAAAAQAARADPVFARPLPPGYAGADFDPSKAEQEFARLTQRLMEGISMAPALEMVSRDFLHGRRPRVAGVIAAGGDGGGPGTRFKRRALVQWRLATREGEAVLTGAGGDLHFPLFDGDALEVALSGHCFRVEDLPCPAPERLFRTLWANGYLERAPAG